MALTDTGIKALKHSGRPAGDKHSDGHGLHLHVTAAGKYWRLAYRFAGKQRTLALGVYPAVGLAKAREKRGEARAALAAGIDPFVVKRADKLAKEAAAANTFAAAAREYHAVKKGSWSEKYAAKWLGGMVANLFPPLGHRPIAEITPVELLAVLRRVESRGRLDKAHTLKQNAGQVFRYAVQTGKATTNPATELTGALTPHTPRHMSAITDPVKVGELLRAIDGYEGHPTTRAALQLAALIFQRPGNVRQLEWAWVDLDAAMLTIPAVAMKRRKADKINGRPHFVPLAPQAVAILAEQRLLTGAGRYAFPSLRTGERPMSDNTLNAALRRMGFAKDEMSAHGFRAMARTVLAEHLDVDPEVIEAQLAHGKSGPLGAAYDRTSFMRQRLAMMTTWADHLDKLRRGADVIPLRTANA